MQIKAIKRLYVKSFTITMINNISDSTGGVDVVKNGILFIVIGSTIW